MRLRLVFLLTPILVLAFLLVSGCATKMSDLTPPTKDSYFVLEKDVFKSTKSEKSRWVYGLKAGVYPMVGEDTDGFYYQGSGDTVFFLSQERADRYLLDGYVTPYPERYKAQTSIAAGTGGVWFPKDAAKSKPKVFYLVATDPQDATSAGISAGGIATPGASTSVAAMTGGMIIGGATSAVVMSMISGAVSTRPISSVTDDESIFKLVDGKPR